MESLLPQQHVRDESVGLGALQQTAELLLGQLGIDVEQRDGVKGRVPEPLKRVRGGRRAHEVVAAPVPVRDAGLAVVRQDAARFGGDLLGVRRDVTVSHLRMRS